MEFVYGKRIVDGKLLACDRLHQPSMTGLVLGNHGSGKSLSMKREIENVLSCTKDFVYVVCLDMDTAFCEYQYLANKYGGTVITVSGSYYSNPVVIPENKQFVVISLAVTFPEKLAEHYRSCLEKLWGCILHNGRNGMTSWLYLEDVHTFSESEYIFEAICTMAKRSKTYRCVITCSAQSVTDIVETNFGRDLLKMTAFRILLRHDAMYRNSLKKLCGIPETMLSYLSEKRPEGAGLFRRNSEEFFIPFVAVSSQESRTGMIADSSAESVGVTDNCNKI